jgi:hypothetical protein
MESIGTDTRVAPIARSPLDSARGRRRPHSKGWQTHTPTHSHTNNRAQVPHLTINKYEYPTP